MDRLVAMNVFVKVVEKKSFTQAADVLGYSKPVITRTIQSLESHLNTQLFQRSTRRVSVTAEGERYYQHCRKFIEELSELEDSFSLRREDTRGRLRIALPPYVAKHFVVPRLDEFKTAYPNIDLSLSVSEPDADIALTGADCIIKLGPLSDINLVARPLAEFEMVTAASEGFLRRYGVPTSPNDLDAYRGISHSANPTRHCEMNFKTSSQPMHARLMTQVAVDDAETAIVCAASGMGFVQSLRFLVQPYINSGQLLEMFPNQCPAPRSLFAVYPKMKHRSRALQIFVKWLHDLFEQEPSTVVCHQDRIEFPSALEGIRFSSAMPTYRDRVALSAASAMPQ